MLEGMEAAFKTLAYVRRHNPSKENTFHLEAYCNCREQGFCVKGWLRDWCFSCSFSESRGSDQVVVYVEETMRVPSFQSTSGNIPPDAIYHKASYFRTPLEAGQYICGKMAAFLDNHQSLTRRILTQ